MLNQFHFLEPLWLLALIPLIAIFWLLSQAQTHSRTWEKVIDAKLLPLLLQGEDKNTHTFAKWLLAAAWLLAVIALADPVWEKVPRPIFQTNAARVIVLDLSNSMLIDDLKPSRLARARFKIEDILSREEEGQTGLVLFAGEAFTAAPLTRDTETIRSMLNVLKPQIMPAQGSRVDLGLTKAHELLTQAGIINGKVLLIADGVSQESLSIKATADLRKSGHSVSVMAVGTEAGGKLNFRNDTSVTVKLDAQNLSEIAKKGGGNYHVITTNNKDLKLLLTSSTDGNLLDDETGTKANQQDLQNSEWQSTGPLFVLLLLPFAALAFRRGWILSAAFSCLLVGLVSPSAEVMAAENKPQITEVNKWQDLADQLLKNKAQRASSALAEKQYDKALDLSDDPLVRGSAEYKLKNYDSALASFKNSKGADARYNEGNALAKLKKYEDAIAAYDEALKLNSNMQDALDNKKVIEDFLKQQQQSSKNNQSSNENQQGNSDAENKEQNQQVNNDQQNQGKQSSSQSNGKNGKDSEQEQKNSQRQEQQKNQENQFSEANKDLDKNKQEAEEEAVQTAKDKSSNNDKSDGKKSASDKNEALAGDDKKPPGTEQDEQKESREKSTDAAQIKVPSLAEELSKEEKMAAEQWLRRIPDDPGGLLRRKFRHQYNQNRRNSNTTEQPW